MTKDECLLAISAAFDDVYVEAVVGYWNVRIATSPKRELVLTAPFVERNVSGPGMTPDELATFVKSIPESRWAQNTDGSKILAL